MKDDNILKLVANSDLNLKFLALKKLTLMWEFSLMIDHASKSDQQKSLIWPRIKIVMYTATLQSPFFEHFY